jgi:hypothetical protein
LKFTGSNPECACDDSEVPTLITPTCSGGGGGGLTYVVDACGLNSAITVTSATVLGETTYTVCFDDAIWQKINALTQVVITSNDASVTIVPTLNGYIMTYDLSVAISPTASPVHIFSGVIEIDMTNKANPPILQWRPGFNSVWGNKLQVPNIVNENPTNPNWRTQQNCFYLDGYIAGAGGEFPKPIMQIVEVHAPGQSSDSVNCKDPRNLIVIIKKIDVAQDRIYFQILDKTFDNYPVNGGLIQETQDLIRISVHINA